MTTPWVELYRPLEIDQIAHQEHVVSLLKQCLRNKDMPHFLLFGPQGTGKSTSVRALGYALFGPKYFKQRMHEINASVDRGVKIIREKVKPLAQRKISTVTPEDGYAYPVPPFQIIVLEEADAMTKDAQGALRRIIEDNSSSTRICLCCNYVSQIITPLTSRCAKLRFSPLPSPIMTNRLIDIAQMAGIDADKDVLVKIAERAGGDMRKAVTTFQIVSTIAGHESLPDKTIHQNILNFTNQKNIEKIETDQQIQNKAKLTEEHLRLFDLTNGIISEDQLKSICEQLQNESKENVIQTIQDIISCNYDMENLLQRIYEYICLQTREDELSDKIRNKVARQYQLAGHYLAKRTSEDLIIYQFLLGVSSALQS